MTITTLPTRASDDLGAALANSRTPRTGEASAVNYERFKDRIIELAAEVGLTDGSTAGSLRKAIDDLLTDIGAAVSPDPGSIRGRLDLKEWNSTVLSGGSTSPTAPTAILVDTSVSAIIQLPNPATISGEQFFLLVVDRENNAAGKPIELRRSPQLEKIDNVAAHKSLAVDGGRWLVWTDGVNWYTHASSSSALASYLRLDGASTMEGPLAMDGYELSMSGGDIAGAGSVAANALTVGGSAAVTEATKRTLTIPAVRTSAYTILGTEDVILVDDTAGRVDLTAPAIALVRTVRIQKVAGGTGGIRIVRTGAEQINGAASSYDLPGATTAWSASTPQAWDLYSDGVQRYVADASSGSGGGASVGSGVVALGTTTSDGASATAARVDHVHASPIFGRESQYTANEGAALTTSSPAQQVALTWTTAALVGGTYRIGWYCEVGATATAGLAWLSWYLDGALQSSDRFSLTGIDTTNAYFDQFTGFRDVVLGAGTHTLIMYLASSAGSTVFALNRRFHIYRIA